MDHIQSVSDLEKHLQKHDKYFVLIHKGSSEVSQCAYKHFSVASEDVDNDFGVGDVDVSQTRDIHMKYQVDTAPSLLVFEKSELKNIVKGCMDEAYYKALLNEEFAVMPQNKVKGKKHKNVIVYSTPTCSWCTKIKQHLNTHNIPFREVDVAADPARAEEMKRKSGQMGVPQTEIDGQMIVGFDRPKIDRLLDIA